MGCATILVGVCVVLGVLVGLVFGSGVGAYFTQRQSLWDEPTRRGFSGIGTLCSLIGAVIGGKLGYHLGQEWAFWLRLTAQFALCQVEIEKNTKGEKG
ncbi:MAG: hypothetical protein HY814_13305 [Candidatus Riflebacteria bacterium]|nr:hypothetical protein [Candidatus Riflebacteria bacterium]